MQSDVLESQAEPRFLSTQGSTHRHIKSGCLDEPGQNGCLIHQAMQQEPILEGNGAHTQYKYHADDATPFKYLPPAHAGVAPGLACVFAHVAHVACVPGLLRGNWFSTQLPSVFVSHVRSRCSPQRMLEYNSWQSLQVNPI